MNKSQRPILAAGLASLIGLGAMGASSFGCAPLLSFLAGDQAPAAATKLETAGAAAAATGTPWGLVVAAACNVLATLLNAGHTIVNRKKAT